MVSSTTPSDEPRWPPVCATVWTMVSRISTASWASCDLVEAAEVGGVLDGRQDAARDAMAPDGRPARVAGFGRADGSYAARVMIGSQSIGPADGSAQSVNLSLTGRSFRATRSARGCDPWRSSSSTACGQASRTASSPPPTRATTKRGPPSTRRSSGGRRSSSGPRTVEDVVAAVVAAGDLGPADRGPRRRPQRRRPCDGRRRPGRRPARDARGHGRPGDAASSASRAAPCGTTSTPPPGRTTWRSSAGRSATRASPA